MSVRKQIWGEHGPRTTGEGRRRQTFATPRHQNHLFSPQTRPHRLIPGMLLALKSNSDALKKRRFPLLTTALVKKR